MSTLNVRQSINNSDRKSLALRKNSLSSDFFWINQAPISLKDIVNKCNEPGQIHRTAFLEIDMIQGTAFPPDELLFEDRFYTIQDIYLQAGIILDIRKDENNIPDLAGEIANTQMQN